MREFSKAIRWVVALKCEAEPIIQYFKMDCYINTGPFSVFCDREKEHWLVLSGIGQINSASATTYLSEISDAPPWAGWINIGIAGYGGEKTEDLLLVDEVQQFSTGHTLYPGPVIGNDLQRYSLITVDKPSKNYKQGHLVDMEGYAFFEIASRLSSQQLTIILKIISDGPDEPLELIKPETVTENISRIINNLKTLVQELENICLREAKRLAQPKAYKKCIQTWHFTSSQKTKCLKLIRKWESIFPSKDLFSIISMENDAKSVLSKISQHTQKYEIDWINSD